MMKRIALLILSVACAAQLHAQATNVTMTVALQTPMPRSFAEWQRNDRTLVTVTILNYDAVTYNNVRLSAKVIDADNGNVVAFTKDNDPNMKRFPVPQRIALGVPSVTILRGRDCINANAIQIDPKIQTQAITTNSLPEGNFQFCAKLLKEDGSDLTHTGTGGDCSAFGVVIPDPPVLLTPPDSMGLAEHTLPFFSWTAAAPLAPGTMALYWLKIVPVFPSQSPQDAIDHNQVLLNKSWPGTSYQYLPDDLHVETFFSQTRTFAWQITAHDLQLHTPLTANEGKSEVRTFHFDTLKVLTAPPPPPKPAAGSGGR